ncbi:hypothetical protein C8J57DRAFT_1403106 [Mycena rebaudengoi]|nr:hypothetical protein C8J57DRAFT_1403106 [Mycena rebaudengoi]
MQHDFWGSFGWVERKQIYLRSATYTCTAYRVCTYLLLLLPPAILAQIPTAESTLCKHISLLDMKIKIENVKCMILQGAIQARSSSSRKGNLTKSLVSTGSTAGMSVGYWRLMATVDERCCCNINTKNSVSGAKEVRHQLRTCYSWGWGQQKF